MHEVVKPRYLSLTYHVSLSLRLTLQARCENILRSQPQSRIAKELHLASIEAEEQRNQENIKRAAIGSVAAAAAVGVAAGVIGLLLKR